MTCSPPRSGRGACPSGRNPRISITQTNRYNKCDNNDRRCVRPPKIGPIMSITAEYVTSAARLDQLPAESLPEIALTGRSNVGKSSLINALVGKQGLARISSAPGRTQTLNYYRITPDEKQGMPFFLVDMPGYGFAQVSKGSRIQWLDLIGDYLESRSALRCVMQIIDLRHTPTPPPRLISIWRSGCMIMDTALL
jgi:ribosome biogenesis GTP-binding protein YsxC/EngB